VNRLRFRRLQVAVGRENPTRTHSQRHVGSPVGRAFVECLGRHWMLLQLHDNGWSSVSAPANVVHSCSAGDTRSADHPVNVVHACSGAHLPGVVHTCTATHPSLGSAAHPNLGSAAHPSLGTAARLPGVVHTCTAAHPSLGTAARPSLGTAGCLSLGSAGCPLGAEVALAVGLLVE